MIPPAASTTLIALVLSLASAGTAGSQDVRTAPPTIARTKRIDMPGGAFRGVWSSDKDSSGAVLIMSLRGAAISIVAAGRFEAVGYADGSTGVALAAFPGPAASANTPVRYGVLRLERRDERALRVRFADGLDSAPTAQETWTLRSAQPEQPTEVVPALPIVNDSSRSGGGYIYVEELPEAIEKTPPAYPPAARAGGVEGQVLVQALIGKDGRVRDIRVIRSVPQLDAAAVACVRQWRFKPALSKGEPIEVWIAGPVKFSLH
jgi:protein TonB